MTVIDKGRAEAGALADLVVLDLTTFLSGPHCTQILADLGAQVIKVEAPEGDFSRSVPPHFVAGESAYFLHVNRNKRSIAIDLKTPNGKRVLHELIAISDVVVENFRPGVLGRLGIDVTALREQRPGLIWASITGFGLYGANIDRPAYDMVVQALSGVMSLTGEPGGAPVRLGIPAGDLVAGMYAAIGILSAVHSREKRGGGDHLDVAMLDCQLAMLSYQATYAMVSGVTPQPQGSRHDSIPTYRTFEAGDGRRLVVTANTERMWAALCETLGLAHLAADPRFANSGQRLANAIALWSELEPAFLKQTAASWVDHLTERGVPACLILNVSEALDEARGAGRGMVLDLDNGAGARVSVVGNPIKSQQDPQPSPSFPPRLGEDTRAILADQLGMAPTEIESLLASGAVRAGEPALEGVQS